MPNIDLFPFAEYWPYYLGFTTLVLILLALDLGLFHRKAHTVEFREATLWCIAWVSLAMLFAWGLHSWASWKFAGDPRLASLPGWDAGRLANQVTLEYLTGYVIELSLSVDNLFVFVVVFQYFGVPHRFQHRVLFYGILGALIFRATFIAIGAALIQYQWVVVVFGLFLIFTGIKLMRSDMEKVEPEKNLVIRAFRRYVPVTTQLVGGHFLVRTNGVLFATPLLITVLFLEMTDIMFAIDSVPAIFAITRQPLVVFTSNIFAILGLRSMYFLLAGAITRFYLLKYGLAIVLMFVGLKMVLLNHLFGGHFPIHISLAFILTVILTSIVLSLYFSRKRGAPADDVAAPVEAEPHARS
ncbi:MAG: TerC/Alx family metal homeostasis membrane protein [Bryobacteraceae bacterium]|nr:TerC/Alx family metal homeostasis membrane protein [Bryobacteraceae bacterium]